MVGSAQYRDEEIGWILAAVVARKKQDYIQRNFEIKFGRPLNHNQIRYIKNKYGKDPRFNSPMINIRTARAPASPSMGEPDSNDEEEIVPLPTLPPPEDAARAQISDPGPEDSRKRKRGSEDGEEGPDSNTRRTQAHRANASSSSMMSNTQGGVAASDMPPWVAMRAQMAAPLQSLSAPTATPEASSGDLSMYGSRQQQLMQGTSSYNRPSSINDLWSFGDPSGLINPSRHHPSTTLQEAARPIPIDLSAGFEQFPALSFQPAAWTPQNCSQVPPPYSVELQPQLFTPPSSNAVYSPSVTVDPRHRPSSGSHLSTIQDLSFQQSFTGFQPLPYNMSGNAAPRPLMEPFVERPMSNFDSIVDTPPAEYTISTRDSTNTSMLVSGPHELLVSGSGLEGVAPVASQQSLGLPVSNHESQGPMITASFADFHHMFSFSGPDIPREVPVNAAEMTAAVYEQTMPPSVVAAADLPTKTTSTTEAQQYGEMGDEQLYIDPELLLAFPSAGEYSSGSLFP